MKNTAIVISLGLAFCISLVALIDSKKEYDNYVAAEAKFTEESVEKTSAGYSFLSLYDINELKQGYKKPSTVFGKTMIEVPVVNQYPELPVGCEVASCTAALNYIGIDIDKMTMLSYFETDSTFTDISGGRRTGPDPDKVFVGDPRDNGFGCFPAAIKIFLNNYFKDNGYNYNAIELKNANEQDLQALLDNGIPVIVWATVNMRPYKFTDDNEWVLNTTGEDFRWPGNSHVLVLCGYDDKNYYFSDPNDKADIVFYKNTDFIQRWMQNDCKGIIIDI